MGFQKQDHSLFNNPVIDLDSDEQAHKLEVEKDKKEYGIKKDEKNNNN